MQIALEISPRSPGQWESEPDPHTGGVDPKALASVLRRDHQTCQACGYIAKGTDHGLEMHHRDDDHRNHRADNLLTVCPMCHLVFHVGLTGIQGRGRIILSAVRQEHICLLSTIAGVTSALDVNDSPVAVRARKLLDRISQDGVANLNDRAPAWTDGSALMYARYLSELQPSKRDRVAGVISDIRLLPSMSHPRNKAWFVTAASHFARHPLVKWPKVAELAIEKVRAAVSSSAVA